MVDIPFPPLATGSAATRETELAGACGMRLACTRFLATERTPAETAPVLYTHGFGQTRGAWLRTGVRLAARGHAGLAYDARGHGDSQRNPKGLAYDGDQFVDDLIIVAGEHAEPPVLVGASMGGLFGLLAESRWPGLFSALVLVDITPHWDEAGLARILQFVTAFPEGFDSLEHAAEVVARYLPHRRTRKTADELAPLLQQAQDGRWHWHWDRRLVDDLVRDSARHQDDIAAAARSVRCPVLLVSGGRSELISEDHVRAFQALVPHAQHIQVANVGHMLAGDDNDAFTTVVLDFLGTLSRARHSRSFNTAFDPASGARS